MILFFFRRATSREELLLQTKPLVVEPGSDDLVRRCPGRRLIFLLGCLLIVFTGLVAARPGPGTSVVVGHESTTAPATNTSVGTALEAGTDAGVRVDAPPDVVTDVPREAGKTQWFLMFQP